MIGGVAGAHMVGGFIKQMGLSSTNTPQLNAARMAESMYARMDSPEVQGRHWRKGPALRRREVMRRPDELPDLDEDLIDLINGTEPYKLAMRTTAETWMAGVEDAEMESASRLRMLIWGVELFAFAGDAASLEKRQAMGEFCFAQYQIDANDPPPEYAASTGPWRIVKHCRRYDVLSKQVRAREMFKAKAPREDWGA